MGPGIEDDHMELALSEEHKATLEWGLVVARGRVFTSQGSLVMGGGAVLAMHWRHRHGTDLDLVVAGEPMPGVVGVRARLERLQKQGVVKEWRIHRGRSVLLDGPCGKVSLVFEPRRPETENHTHLHIPCESPASILRRKLLYRVVESGRFPTRDFYDFAWAASRHPALFQEASGDLSPDDLQLIENRCLQLAKSKPERRLGPPVLHPADRELARTQWSVCAGLFKNMRVAPGRAIPPEGDGRDLGL